jgi:hypothetical protein
MHKCTLAYYFTVVTRESGASCDDGVVVFGSLQAVLVMPLAYICYHPMRIPGASLDHKYFRTSEVTSHRGCIFYYQNKLSHLYQFRSTRRQIYTSHAFKNSQTSFLHVSYKECLKSIMKSN